MAPSLSSIVPARYHSPLVFPPIASTSSSSSSLHPPPTPLPIPSIPSIFPSSSHTLPTSAAYLTSSWHSTEGLVAAMSSAPKIFQNARTLWTWEFMLSQNFHTLVLSLVQNATAQGGFQIEQHYATATVNALSQANLVVNLPPPPYDAPFLNTYTVFEAWHNFCRVNHLMTFPITSTMMSLYLSSLDTSRRPLYLTILEQYRKVTSPILQASIVNPLPNWNSSQTLLWHAVVSDSTVELVSSPCIRSLVQELMPASQRRAALQSSHPQLLQSHSSQQQPIQRPPRPPIEGLSLEEIQKPARKPYTSSIGKLPLVEEVAEADFLIACGDLNVAMEELRVLIEENVGLGLSEVVEEEKEEETAKIKEKVKKDKGKEKGKEKEKTKPKDKVRDKTTSSPVPQLGFFHDVPSSPSSSSSTHSHSHSHSQTKPFSPSRPISIPIPKVKPTLTVSTTNTSRSSSLAFETVGPFSGLPSATSTISGGWEREGTEEELEEEQGKKDKGKGKEREKEATTNKIKWEPCSGPFSVLPLELKKKEGTSSSTSNSNSTIGVNSTSSTSAISKSVKSTQQAPAKPSTSSLPAPSKASTCTSKTSSGPKLANSTASSATSTSKIASKPSATKPAVPPPTQPAFPGAPSGPFSFLPIPALSKSLPASTIPSRATSTSSTSTNSLSVPTKRKRALSFVGLVVPKTEFLSGVSGTKKVRVNDVKEKEKEKEVVRMEVDGDETEEDLVQETVSEGDDEETASEDEESFSRRALKGIGKGSLKSSEPSKPFG